MPASVVTESVTYTYLHGISSASVLEKKLTFLPKLK